MAAGLFISSHSEAARAKSVAKFLSLLDLSGLLPTFEAALCTTIPQLLLLSPADMDAMNIVGGIRSRLLNGIAALQGLCDICDGEAQYLEVVMDVEVGITSDAEETRRRDDEVAIAELLAKPLHVSVDNRRSPTSAMSRSYGSGERHM